MSALILTPECSGAVGDFLHAFGIQDGEPDHEACPGSQTTPGLLGGWHCSCPCHHTPPPKL